MTKRGNKHISSINDNFTKFTQIYAVPHRTAKSAVIMLIVFMCPCVHDSSFLLFIWLLGHFVSVGLFLVLSVEEGLTLDYVIFYMLT